VARKDRKDRYSHLVDGKAYQINEADVEAALEGKTLADNPEETHEREECDSEHGVPEGSAMRALVEAGASGAENICYLITEHYYIMTQT